jgi:tRNA A37 threonylcarbamoyladenosine modification protein TsaB
MRFLFIDTSEMGKVRIGILPSVMSFKSRSGSLLPLIAKKIGLAKLKSADGICVVSGPGSFSSVRAGVLVANVLSHVLGKPLYGITVSEAEDLDALVARLEKKSVPAAQFVAPVYNAEPNITVKK